MTVDSFELIDALFTAAQQQGMSVKSIRLGKDRESDFRERAGVPFDERASTYFGVPITFDAIDPSAVIVESEPLVE